MADEVAGKAYIELEAKMNNLEASIVSEIRTIGSKSGTTFASSFQTALSPLKGYIASIVSVTAVTQIGKEILTLASQVQQAKIAFDKLTGSAELSIKLLNDIKTFAKTTPFDQMGLVDGAKRLLAYGFTAQNIIPIMNSLGNAVSAVGGGQDTLNGVIVALGQMQTKGHLVQQEVNQIAERGIPIFDILKEKLGLTNKELGDLGNQGISSAKAIPLILEGINERYAGIMDQQALTLQGRFSNLMDVVKISMADVGLSTADGMGKAISSVTAFINENHDAIVQYATDATDVIGNFVQTASDIIGSAGTVIKDVADTGASSIKDMNDSVSSDTEKTMSGLTGDWTDFLYYFKLGLDTILGSISVVVSTIVATIGGVFSFMQTGGDSVVKIIVGTVTGAIGTISTFIENVGSKLAGAIVSMTNGMINGVNRAVKNINKILPSNMNIGTVSNITYTAPKIDGSSNWKLLQEGTSEFGKARNNSFSAVGDAWNTTTNKMATNLENDYLKRVKAIKDKETSDFIKSEKEKMSADVASIDQRIKNGEKLSDLEQKSYDAKKQYIGELDKKFVASSGAMDDSMDKSSKKSSETTKSIIQDYKDINSGITDSSKKIDGYKDDIEKIGDKFKDLKDTALKNIAEINLSIQDLGTKTDEKVGNRFAELQLKLKDLKGELKANGTDTNSIDATSIDMFKSMKTGGVEEVFGSNIDKIIEYKNTQKEIKDAIANTTKEVRDQAVAYSELNETQQILYDKQKSLLELEEKKAISQSFGNQNSLSQDNLQIKTTGDTTEAFYKNETGVLVQIKDFKNIQYAQDLVDKQVNLQADLKLVEDKKTTEEGLYKILSETKALYEQNYTSILRTEINKQKGFVDELIQKYRDLNAVKSASSDTTIARRAYGGNVQAGQIYLTGENHHNELFTPTQNGYIAPSYDNSKHINVDVGQILSNNPQDFGDWLRSNIGNLL